MAPRTKRKRRIRKRGFTSDQQRAAVMAILAEKKHLLTPKATATQLRRAGFYPQGKKLWATWIGGRNEYLHRLAYELHNPKRPIRKGEEVHHKNKNRYDNTAGNLIALRKRVHTRVGNEVKEWEKKPVIGRVPTRLLDVAARVKVRLKKS